MAIRGYPGPLQTSAGGMIGNVIINRLATSWALSKYISLEKMALVKPLHTSDEWNFTIYSKYIYV